MSSTDVLKKKTVIKNTHLEISVAAHTFTEAKTDSHDSFTKDTRGADKAYNSEQKAHAVHIKPITPKKRHTQCRQSLQYQIPAYFMLVRCNSHCKMTCSGRPFLVYETVWPLVGCLVASRVELNVEPSDQRGGFGTRDTDNLDVCFFLVFLVNQTADQRSYTVG